MMNVKQWLIGNLFWEISSRTQVQIGLDPINGFYGDHSLPTPLIMYMHNQGL